MVVATEPCDCMAASDCTDTSGAGGVGSRAGETLSPTGRERVSKVLLHV